MTHIRTNSFEPRHSAPVQPSTSFATPKVTADRINTNRLQHSAALMAPRLEAKLLLQAWPCQHTRHWSFRQLAAQDLCLTSKGWQEVKKEWRNDMLDIGHFTPNGPIIFSYHGSACSWNSQTERGPNRKRFYRNHTWHEPSHMGDFVHNMIQIRWRASPNVTTSSNDHG